MIDSDKLTLKEKLGITAVCSVTASLLALVWGMPEMLYSWPIAIRFGALIAMTAILIAGTVSAAILAAMAREVFRLLMARIKRNAGAVQLCGRDDMYVCREVACRAAGRGR